MKESAKSLRAYFMIVGVLSILGNLSSLGSPGYSAILKALSLIQLIVGGAFLYAGVKLDELLRTKPDTLLQLILASVAISLLGALGTAGLIVSYAGFSAALNVGVILPIVLVPLIGAYLYANVKRLAAEIAKG